MNVEMIFVNSLAPVTMGHAHFFCRDVHVLL